MATPAINLRTNKAAIQRLKGLLSVDADRLEEAVTTLIAAKDPSTKDILTGADLRRFMLKYISPEMAGLFIPQLMSYYRAIEQYAVSPEAVVEAVRTTFTDEELSPEESERWKK